MTEQQYEELTAKLNQYDVLTDKIEELDKLFKDLRDVKSIAYRKPGDMCYKPIPDNYGAAIVQALIKRLSEDYAKTVCERDQL